VKGTDGRRFHNSALKLVVAAGVGLSAYTSILKAEDGGQSEPDRVREDVLLAAEFVGYLEDNSSARRRAGWCADFDYSNLPTIREHRERAVSSVSLHIDPALRDGGVEFFPAAGNIAVLFRAIGIDFSLVEDASNADVLVSHIEAHGALPEFSLSFNSGPHCASGRLPSGQIQAAAVSGNSEVGGYYSARARCIGEAVMASTGYSYSMSPRDVYGVDRPGDAPRGVLVEYSGGAIGFRFNEAMMCTAGFNEYAIDKNLSPSELLLLLPVGIDEFSNRD